MCAGAGWTGGLSVRVVPQLCPAVLQNHETMNDAPCGDSAQIDLLLHLHKLSLSSANTLALYHDVDNGGHILEHIGDNGVDNVIVQSSLEPLCLLYLVRANSWGKSLSQVKLVAYSITVILSYLILINPLSWPHSQTRRSVVHKIVG